MTVLKRFVLTSLSLAVLASSVSVHARAGSSGSRSSSSMSSSKAAAPAPRPAPAPAPAAAPQRASIGGMQRSNVMSEARSQKAAPATTPSPAPAPAPRPVPAPAPAVAAAAAPSKQAAPASFWPSAGATNSTSSQASRRDAERREAERREAERNASRRSGLTTGQAMGAAAVVGVGAYMLGSNAAAQPAPAAPVQPSATQATPSTTSVNGAVTSVQTPLASAPETPSAQAGGAWPQAHAESVAAKAQHSESSATSSAMASQVETVLGGALLKLALTLLVLGGAAMLAYRMFASRTKQAGVKGDKFFGEGASASAESSDGLFRASSPVAEAPSQAILLVEAPKMFRAVQDANNTGDKLALENMCDEAYLPVLTTDIDNRTEPSRTHVMSVEVVGNRVLGFERDGYRYVGSVHFRARISEGSEPVEDIQEVWHFVANAEGSDRSQYGGWKLAGIEVV